MVHSVVGTVFAHCPVKDRPPHFRRTYNISSLTGDEVIAATMSSGDDAIFPDSVKDFVFDLHDVTRRSFISSEQQSLYASSFREITAKVRSC